MRAMPVNGTLSAADPFLERDAQLEIHFGDTGQCFADRR